MLIVTTSDATTRMGELIDTIEHDPSDTVLIQRNDCPAAMLLHAELAERLILLAYTQGAVSRGMAMQQLGLNWYGDLLQRLHNFGLSRPEVSKEHQAEMTQTARTLFGTTAEHQGCT